MIFQCWDLSRIVLVPLAARSRWMPRCPCACVPSITYESSQLNHDVCRCTTTSLSKAPVAHSIIQSTISCRSLLIFIDVCVGETYKTHKQSDSKSCSEVEWPKWPKATPIVISACNQRKSGAAGQLKAMERTVVKLTVKISGLGMHWDGLYIVSLRQIWQIKWYENYEMICFLMLKVQHFIHLRKTTPPLWNIPTSLGKNLSKCRGLSCSPFVREHAIDTQTVLRFKSFRGQG